MYYVDPGWICAAICTSGICAGMKSFRQSAAVVIARETMFSYSKIWGKHFYPPPLKWPGLAQNLKVGSFWWNFQWNSSLAGSSIPGRGGG